MGPEHEPRRFQVEDHMHEQCLVETHKCKYDTTARRREPFHGGVASVRLDPRMLQISV